MQGLRSEKVPDTFVWPTFVWPEERVNHGDLAPLPPPKKLPNKIPQQLEEKPPKEILLAEHMVSNAIWLNENKFVEDFQQALPAAKEQLAALSAYEQCWVRLYVAEIMRQHRELRMPEVLKKLSSDSNDLVSKTAKAILATS